MFLFSLHGIFLPFHSCLQYIVQRFVKLAQNMANVLRFADFLFSPLAWVFPKSLLIALWNITFTLLALVLCFISCWKNVLFSLLSRLFVAKNSFYNHINFYVEVTNALKVVYREVLIHRPYNRKTTENGIWNIRLLMSRVFHRSRLIALFFALTVVSHLSNTHPTHFTFPFTTYPGLKNVRNIERLRLGSVSVHNYNYQ